MSENDLSVSPIKNLTRRFFPFRLENKPLRFRLISVFCVILSFNLLCSLYLIGGLQGLKADVIKMYDQPLMVSTYAMSAKYHFERLDNLVRMKFGGPSTAVDVVPVQKLQDQLEQAQEDLAVVKERASTTQELDLVKRIETLMKSFATFLNATPIFREKGLSQAQMLTSWSENNEKNEIQKLLSDLTEIAAETGYVFRERSQKDTHEKTLVSVGISLGVFLVSFILAIIMTNSITGPLVEYAQVCRLVEQGDLRKRVPAGSGKSEIALLGRSFNQMLERLVRANVEVESLLRVVIHDIATPLMIAQSNLKKMSMPDLPAEKRAVTASRLNAAISNMTQILEQVRLLKSVRDGKQVVTFQQIDLKLCIQEVVDLLISKAEDKNIHFKIDFSPGEHLIMGDRGVLSHFVLMNFLTNAIKFSHPNGTIELSLSRVNGDEVIQVRDYGIGIPKELLATLWSSTAVTSRLGTSGEKGTGYGMPIAKEFIEKMGGQVRVDSDHGTCISLSFRALVKA